MDFPPFYHVYGQVNDVMGICDVKKYPSVYVKVVTQDVSPKKKKKKNSMCCTENLLRTTCSHGMVVTQRDFYGIIVMEKIILKK